MNKIEMDCYGLNLYSEKLDNGLEINIVPNSKVNNIYVTFSAKYGSIHDEFIPIDGKKFYKVPMGVAHFLEHKVFEQEDGVDPFTVFSSYGADCNANTSNYKTSYLFSSPTNFKENMELLLNFVQSPYFTNENVEKEKGIIAQELKMLADNPAWKLYDKTLYNAFIEHPIRYPIGGTLKSIYKITKEDLYTCYNTFYHPANMFITVTGHVEPKEVVKIIKDNQSSKNFKPFKPIVIKKYHESDEVRCPYEEIKMDVSIPKVSLAYKINVKDYDVNRLRIYLNIYLNLIVGTTSLLTEELRKEKLISNSLGYDLINTDSHILCTIDFESEKYDRIIEKLKEIIGKVRVKKTDFERKIKCFKSSCIYRTDNIYAINSRINNNIIDYHLAAVDELAIIDSLTFDELNDILDNIDFTKISVVVIKGH